MRPRKEVDRDELQWLLALRRSLRIKELMARYACSRSFIDCVSRESKHNACVINVSDVVERILHRRGL